MPSFVPRTSAMKSFGSGRQGAVRRTLPLFVSVSQLTAYFSTRELALPRCDANIGRAIRITSPQNLRTLQSDGRRYHLDNITSPSYRPNLIYEYKGYQPPEKGWAVSRETMERMDAEGRLYFPVDKTKRIRRKRYLDELAGDTVDNLWMTFHQSTPRRKSVWATRHRSRRHF